MEESHAEPTIAGAQLQDTQPAPAAATPESALDKESPVAGSSAMGSAAASVPHEGDGLETNIATAAAWYAAGISLDECARWLMAQCVHEGRAAFVSLEHARDAITDL
jgi:hypothetical protein